MVELSKVVFLGYEKKVAGQLHQLLVLTPVLVRIPKRFDLWKVGISWSYKL